MKRRRAFVWLIMTGASALLGASALEADAMHFNGGSDRFPETVCQFTVQLEDVQYLMEYLARVTCHEPLSKTAMHLVKSDKQSALRFTCHNK